MVAIENIPQRALGNSRAIHSDSQGRVTCGDGECHPNGCRHRAVCCTEHQLLLRTGAVS